MSEARVSAAATATRGDATRIGGIIPAPRESLAESIDDRSTERREGADHLGMSYPGVRYAMERLGILSR